MATNNLITPVARISYPHLDTPQPAQNEGEPAKYGCALVFDAGTDISDLKRAAIEAAKEKWGDKAAAMIRGGKLRMPFRDDAEEKGYPEGSVFISARSERQPGCVSRYADPATGKARVIEDVQDEVYPGAQVKALLHAYAYDTKGNKGVTFALDGIQKWDDDERFDGRVKAEDAFDAEMPAVADLSDLEEEETTGDDEGEDEPPKPAKKPKGKGKTKPADDAGDDDLNLADLL